MENSNHSKDLGMGQGGKGIVKAKAAETRQFSIKSSPKPVNAPDSRKRRGGSLANGRPDGHTGQVNSPNSAKGTKNYASPPRQTKGIMAPYNARK